jgi:hypothetical protein
MRAFANIATKNRGATGIAHPACVVFKWVIDHDLYIAKRNGPQAT